MEGGLIIRGNWEGDYGRAMKACRRAAFLYTRHVRQL